MKRILLALTAVALLGGCGNLHYRSSLDCQASNCFLLEAASAEIDVGVVRALSAVAGEPNNVDFNSNTSIEKKSGYSSRHGSGWKTKHHVHKNLNASWGEQDHYYGGGW